MRARSYEAPPAWQVDALLLDLGVLVRVQNVAAVLEDELRQRRDEARAIADVRQPRVAVAAEVALQDPSVRGHVVVRQPVGAGELGGGDDRDHDAVGRVGAGVVDEVVAQREDPAVGRVAVHFPRAGYQVRAV